MPKVYIDNVLYVPFVELKQVDDDRIFEVMRELVAIQYFNESRRVSVTALGLLNIISSDLAKLCKEDINAAYHFIEGIAASASHKTIDGLIHTDESLQKNHPSHSTSMRCVNLLTEGRYGLSPNLIHNQAEVFMKTYHYSGVEYDRNTMTFKSNGSIQDKDFNLEIARMNNAFSVWLNAVAKSNQTND